MAASSDQDPTSVRVSFREETDEADLTLPNNDRGVCQICLKQSSRYTCPRCNIPYCSSSCYRDSKHADCSESFYKENFMQALKDSDLRREDRDMMHEMLKRFAETNPADSDDDEDDEYSREEDSLAERLRGIDLDADPEQVWQRLTEAERAEFADIIKSDNLDLLVPPWEPWWTSHDPELVNEITGLGSCDRPPDQLIPKAIETIPRLQDILKNKEPSPLIINDIINIIYSYTFLMRFYNGEVTEFNVEMAQNLLQESEALSKNRNYGSREEAIHSVIENVTKVMKEACGSRLVCLQDTAHILLGPGPTHPLDYVLGALSECWRIVSSAKKSLVKDQSQRPLQKRLFTCKKKLEFDLAWAMAFPQAFRVAAIEVQCIYNSLSKDQEELKATAQSATKRKKEATATKLIEEITGP